MFYKDKLEQLENAHSEGISAVAGQVFESRVKPFLVRNNLLFITGNGTSVIFSSLDRDRVLDLNTSYEDGVLVFSDRYGSGRDEVELDDGDWEQFEDAYEALTFDINAPGVRGSSLAEWMPDYNKE